MESRLELIDAFVDGERVDATALKNALADADARDYLVDAWLLREAVLGDRTVDPTTITAATGATVATTATVARPVGSRPRSWIVAAAIAGAVLAGYGIGYGTAGRATGPVANPGTVTEVKTPQSGAFPVPAATRTIQLEFHTSPAVSGGD